MFLHHLCPLLASTPAVTDAEQDETPNSDEIPRNPALWRSPEAHRDRRSTLTIRSTGGEAPHNLAEPNDAASSRRRRRKDDAVATCSPKTKTSPAVKQPCEPKLQLTTLEPAPTSSPLPPPRRRREKDENPPSAKAVAEPSLFEAPSPNPQIGRAHV